MENMFSIQELLNILVDNLCTIDEVEKIIIKESTQDDKTKIKCICICTIDNIVDTKVQNIYKVLETIKTIAHKRNIIFNYQIISKEYSNQKKYQEKNIIYDKNNPELPFTLSRKFRNNQDHS